MSRHVPLRTMTRAVLPAFGILLVGVAVSTQGTGNPGAALNNPVAPTAASLSNGKRAYDINCAACHGDKAQGSVKAGVPISIIQEQGGKQPPDVTDARWGPGSTDCEMFRGIRRGGPPTMMAGWDGRIPDDEIWSIVNYLRAIPKGTAVV